MKLGRNRDVKYPQAFDIPDDADRRYHTFDGDLALLPLPVLDDGRDRVLAFLQLGHLGPGDDLHTILLELLARQGCDFRILDRQHLGQNFDYGHIGAEGSDETGELDADGVK